MKDREMYLYLMLFDMMFTAGLELWQNLGMDKEELTKEKWLELSALQAERRKAAMEKIRAHE